MSANVVVMKKIRELCMKRMVGAVIWNILLQAVFITIFVFFINAEIFHPIRWLQHWFSYMFTFSTWLYIIPLSLVIVAEGIVCSRDYVSLQPFYRNRITYIIQLFNLHNQRVAILHLFIGVLVPWIYLSLSTESKYNRFVYKCTDGFSELNCLSEERLYLIFSCVAINQYYLIDNHFLGSRHLTFPIIQLPKLVQIKTQLLPMVKEAVPYTLIPNLIYIILYYYWLGPFLKYVLTVTFTLHFDDITSIENFYGLITLKRLIYLQLLTTITVSSMKLMEMLFKVHLTQRLIFPISQAVADDNNEIMLKDALQCENYPMIQHLAFLDLVKLAEDSPTRRAEIYKLSVPGGHPHVWNALKSECIKIVEDFVNEMTALLIIDKKIPEFRKDTIVQRPRIPHDRPHPRIITEKKSILQKFIQDRYDWFKKRIELFKKVPIIVFFFGEEKEMKIRYTLRKSLLVMWAAQSLSHLSCFSLTEDNYGIVQNELNQIITLLLKLKHVLELLDKYFISTFKFPKCLASYQKGVALKSCVKRSLYRIANAFKHYITDLQLSKDSENKMMSFVNYKE